MDERQKRVLTTLIAGSALSLTLGLTASATELGALEQPLDTGIQDNTVQSPAPATEGGGTNEDGSWVVVQIGDKYGWLKVEFLNQ